MIGRIPPKRRDGKSSFLKLVAYSVIRDEDKPDMPLELNIPTGVVPNLKMRYSIGWLNTSAEAVMKGLYKR